MKLALAFALLTAFTGYAHAGNFLPPVNQYVSPKPFPGTGPCIRCGGIQLKQNYNEIINPVQNYTPNVAKKSVAP